MAARNGAGVFCEHIELLDEAQLEVNKEAVQFRRFQTKEEAIAFKEKEVEEYGRIWSDVTEAPRGGYYVAYCLAGQLAVESVKESGTDYNLVIELTAGYVVGRSWAECH